MKSRALFVAVLASAVCGAAGPAPFSHWDESKLSAPEYPVRMEFNIQVKMRDGTPISTDIYRPDAAGKFPVLVWRTPYGKNRAEHVKTGKWYAERGYVLAVQDVRGRHDSGGTYRFFRYEADDGYDTDQWLGVQPWSNGKIGTISGSYGGYTQLAQGVRQSPYLKALAPEVTTGDICNGWIYSDGAFFMGFAASWAGVDLDGRMFQYAAAVDWPKVYWHLPLIDLNRAAGRDNAGFRELLLHPRCNDPFWKDMNLDVRDIAVPTLVVEGWYDLFLRGALEDDITIRKEGATELARKGKRLMIGPWTHGDSGRNNTPDLPAFGPDRGIDFGPEAAVDLEKLYLAWNDHWLKGIDNGVGEDAPVKLFVMGENKWRNEQEWPLARTQYTKYYFTSGGRANSAVGDGVLSTRAPSGAATDEYIYDPAAPVPTLGGSSCCSIAPQGPRDQRKAELRTDVLVYTTEALSVPLEVTGPISVTLYASTDAKDTDWTAKLVDVHPDGYAQNLQDGIIRARYRDGKTAPASLLEPGKVYEYTIDLWATSNVFLPGHRIRVEVSSSNFPRFDRNLNTGEDPMTGTRMQKARQTIHHSAKYPSHILLPVIPREVR
jgi:putative CocE/NonD family hydrolase